MDDLPKGTINASTDGTSFARSYRWYVEPPIEERSNYLVTINYGDDDTVRTLSSDAGNEPPSSDTALLIAVQLAQLVEENS